MHSPKTEKPQLTHTATLAGIAAGAAYLDGKYHIRKDLRGLWNLKAGERGYARQVQAGKQSLFYAFEETVERMPLEEECLWSRTDDPARPVIRLTWRQTYDASCAYGNYMREELGVQPGELVAFYMQNSVEFVLAVMGTWAIGTAPIFVNYHLAQEALVHCVAVGKVRVLLMDEDEALAARVEEVRGKIEELGVRIVVLDRALKERLLKGGTSRPPDEVRAGVGAM